MNRVYRGILSLSLIASCASLIGLSAARAQDQEDAALQQQIQKYQQNISRDQAQQTSLRRQRQQLLKTDTWKRGNASQRAQIQTRIKTLDQQVSALDRDILKDQEIIRKDQHQLKGYEESHEHMPAAGTKSGHNARPAHTSRWQNNHRANGDNDKP